MPVHVHVSPQASIRHCRPGTPETGERRTALAYEPSPGTAPIRRIAVEHDEQGQWAVVVDGIVLRTLPDAPSAVDEARRLESTPSLAARERDQAARRASLLGPGTR